MDVHLFIYLFVYSVIMINGTSSMNKNWEIFVAIQL